MVCNECHGNDKNGICLYYTAALWSFKIVVCMFALATKSIFSYDDFNVKPFP